MTDSRQLLLRNPKTYCMGSLPTAVTLITAESPQYALLPQARFLDRIL